MNESSVKNKLRRSGFVFTDLNNDTRITARGPKSPSVEGREGERNTIVRAQRNGEKLHSSSHRNHAMAAKKYVKLIEKYG